jgi:hypothetical protein
MTPPRGQKVCGQQPFGSIAITVDVEPRTRRTLDCVECDVLPTDPIVPFILRAGASILVTLAVALLPLLPPEHIHRGGIEGWAEPLVHAHLLVQTHSLLIT